MKLLIAFNLIILLAWHDHFVQTKDMTKRQAWSWRSSSFRTSGSKANTGSSSSTANLSNNANAYIDEYGNIITNPPSPCSNCDSPCSNGGCNNLDVRYPAPCSGGNCNSPCSGGNCNIPCGGGNCNRPCNGGGCNERERIVVDPPRQTCSSCVRGCTNECSSNQCVSGCLNKCNCPEIQRNTDCCQVLHPKECFTDDVGTKRCVTRRHRECSNICSSPVVSIHETEGTENRGCQYIRNYPYVYCGNYGRSDCGQCYNCDGGSNVQECSRRSTCPDGCRRNGVGY